MKNFRFILSVLATTGILYSCTDSSSDKPIIDTVRVAVDTVKKVVEEDSVVIDETEVKYYTLSPEDKKILDLLYAINMNASYMDVKGKYNALKGIRRWIC